MSIQVSTQPGVSRMMTSCYGNVPSDAVGPGNYYTPQAVPGNLSYVKVLVSNIVSPGNFWLQLKGQSTTTTLEYLMDAIEWVAERTLGRMVLMSKYRGIIRYQTFKVSTGWFVFNIIPGYRGLIHPFRFLYNDFNYFFLPVTQISSIEHNSGIVSLKVSKMVLTHMTRLLIDRLTASLTTRLPTLSLIHLLCPWWTDSRALLLDCIFGAQFCLLGSEWKCIVFSCSCRYPQTSSILAALLIKIMCIKVGCSKHRVLNVQSTGL